MTYRECVIVSAYTGYLMCDFSDVHAYIEEKLGRPVFTHELAKNEVCAEIRKRVYPDFIALCRHKGESE